MDESPVLTLFQTHNRTRIERFIEIAPSKKQVFFQLLPLLLHTNDPAMPGFIVNAPQGIADYQPSSRALSVAKIFQRSFTYKQHSYLDFPLQGLYLINDYGSIYYPADPEFDLLVVHSNKVPEQQIQLLEQKLKSIVEWAKTFDIKLSYHLINEDSTISKPLPSDYLDRLYCNGLILAGSVPLWWLIPPEQDNPEEYRQAAQKVLSSRPVSVNVIDFGPVNTRSADTLFQEGYRHSINAMKNGLPAFLDLLYQRTIIDQYPNVPKLSSSYKQQVYGLEEDTFRCDPNVLKSLYLAGQLPESLLGLVRSSLYLLSDEKLTFDIKSPPHPWRRQALASLPTSWQWSHYNIKALDHRYKANFRERLKEFNQSGLLASKFNNLLISFAKQHQLDVKNQQQTLTSLYRELFDSSPDIISALPKNLLPEEGEEFLFLERAGSKLKWNIYEQDNTSSREISPLYSHHSLIRALAWAVCNKLLTKTSRIRVTDKSREVSTSQCLSIIEYLLKSSIAQAHTVNVEQQETLVSWHLFANTETTPKEAFKRQDLNLALRQQDAFNYGFQRTSIIKTLECLALSTHGQCHYFEYDGASAIAEMLSTLVRWKPADITAKNIDSWCHTPNLGTKISQRLTRVCKQLLNHYRNYPSNGNYIVELSERLYKIQWHEDGSDYIRASKQQNIDFLLAENRTHFSATTVDPLFDNEGLYTLLLKQQSEKSISLFLYKDTKQITVYITDEVGSVYRYSFSKMKQQTIVSHLRQFFTKSLLEESEIQLSFSQLEYKNGLWSASEFSDISPENKTAYLPIKIELDDPTAPLTCVIHCGSTVVKGSINNPALFKKVQDLVLKLRSGNNKYPLYINELSFTKQQDIKSRQYVTQKQQLETLLNND